MKKMLAATKTSISEVMETMFFMPVEFEEPSDLKEITLLKENQTRVCRLNFTGDRSGSVILLAPRALLAEMTENFMGEPADSFIDELLEGTLKETVNMVGGNALRKIQASRPFELSIPELIPAAEFPETPSLLLIRTPGEAMAVHVSIQ